MKRYQGTMTLGLQPWLNISQPGLIMGYSAHRGVKSLSNRLDLTALER